MRRRKSRSSLLSTPLMPRICSSIRAPRSPDPRISANCRCRYAAEVHPIRIAESVAFSSSSLLSPNRAPSMISRLAEMTARPSTITRSAGRIGRPVVCTVPSVLRLRCARGTRNSTPPGANPSSSNNAPAGLPAMTALGPRSAIPATSWECQVAGVPAKQKLFVPSRVSTARSRSRNRQSSLTPAFRASARVKMP